MEAAKTYPKLKKAPKYRFVAFILMTLVYILHQRIFPFRIVILRSCYNGSVFPDRISGTVKKDRR